MPLVGASKSNQRVLRKCIMPDTGTAVRAGFVNIEDYQLHNKFKPAIVEVVWGFRIDQARC